MNRAETMRSAARQMTEEVKIDPKKGPYLIVAAAQRAGVEAEFWVRRPTGPPCALICRESRPGAAERGAINRSYR
jgi:hypothetical protein